MNTFFISRIRAATASSSASLALVVWLMLMVGWYIRTAYQSVAQANNQQIALIWLIVCLAILLSLRLRRRALVTVLWCAGLGGVGLVMIFLSGQLLAALIALWLMTLAGMLGDWVLRRIGAGFPDDKLSWCCIALPLGLTMLSMLGLLLALTRQLATLRVWLILVSLTLLRWRTFQQGVRQIRRLLSTIPSRLRSGLTYEQGLLIVLLSCVGLLSLMWALTPEIQFDGANYHLAVPKVYATEQRLVDIPLFIHSYLARLADMLFTISLALHGQMVAKLLVLGMSAWTALVIYVLGRSVFNARSGLWAALLFASTPLVVWLSTTTYIDLCLGLFFLSSLHCFLLWPETRQTGWLLASGILAGGAIGTKLNIVYGFPLIGLILLYDLIKTPQWSPANKFGKLAAYVSLTALIAAPWYVITWVFTGNPFFPLLNGVFRSPILPPDNDLGLSGLWGVGTSPAALLRLPLTATFETHLFGEGLADGAIGLALVFSPLALLLVRRRNRSINCLLGVSSIYCVLLALTFQYARFYIPLHPAICILVAGTLVTFSSSARQQSLAAAVLTITVVVQSVVTPSMYWNIPGRLPLKLVFGQEQPEEFLAQTLLPYRATQYLNSVVTPGQKVLGVGVEQARYYLDAPLGSPGVSPEVTSLLKQGPEEELIERLLQNNYAYLCVNWFGLPDPPPFPFLDETFLARHATLEFEKNHTSVYRLYRANERPAPAPDSPNKASFTATQNPVIVCDGTGLGATTLTWKAPGVSRVEIHVDDPDGPLLTAGEAEGAADTQKWVSDRMVFYLQDVSDGAKASSANTIATIRMKVTSAGCP